MTPPTGHSDEMPLLSRWKLDLERLTALAGGVVAALLLAVGRGWEIALGVTLAGGSAWWAGTHRRRLAERLHAARWDPPTRDPAYSQLAVDVSLVTAAVLFVVVIILARTGVGP
jgi:hypothetical protein